ncbi:aldehyde dehydrogenase family protein [Pseudomonas aeruginosa]
MKHAHLIVPRTLVAGSASGELLYAPTGLSFWGGVDPRSAEVIDRHHPLSGRHLHGRLLAIPGGRGSCTGSSVLLELILGGRAPAAILLREPDEILALGAIVAEELFGRSLPIACLGERFDELAAYPWARLADGRLELHRDAPPPLEARPAEALATDAGPRLDAFDQALLAGEHGEAARLAMRIVLRSLDADSGEALPYAFVQATEAEVDAAARAAERAYPHYRQLSAARRAGFLEAIASRLDALGDDFVALVRRETALPAVRIQGERTRTANQLRLFAEVLRRGDFHGARIDRGQPGRTPPRPDLRQWRIGLGPVAVFGASNFPLAFSTAGGDSAAALAAGCPVVVKAHGGHMATAECVADAILQAAADSGMPDGVFNMVYGSGVGEALVRHPAIRAVGFTGSLKGGRALCDLAAARPQPIPVFAEMSSINPLVVLPEALRRRGRQVAEELAASVTLGCGQFCTKPGLVLGLRSPGFDAFVAALGEALAARPAQSMLNAGTLRSYVEGLQRLERHPGIRRLAGAPQEGRQAHPQLFKADVGLLLEGDELLQDEVFGPATVVVEAADEEQLARALDNLHGQLTATLIGEAEDLAAFAGLVPLLEGKAGRLLFNGYPTGVEVCDAMVHGGPYPATSDARGTSVGTLAIERFLRPLCYQDYPDSLLPDALKNANPLGLLRLVDGRSTREALD